MRNEINLWRSEYFHWMSEIVDKDMQFTKLLRALNETIFISKIPRDENRIADGIDLRRRFILDNGYYSHEELILDCLDGPCSVLELMLALAFRCEENIMLDPDYGDRTSHWFWGMVTTLGLGGMFNDRFDERVFSKSMVTFMNRTYSPNGEGGLFKINDAPDDMRNVEIWTQLLWYLDTIIPNI